MDVSWHRLRKGDLFVLSWARVRHVRQGSVVVEVCTVFCYCLMWLNAYTSVCFAVSSW